MEYNIEFNPRAMHLPCGGTARWDESSGISYRCEHCGAVVGSMGQPQRCKDEAQKYENWQRLGGRGWDYSKAKSK
jgi:hypothetical protein